MPSASLSAAPSASPSAKKKKEERVHYKDDASLVTSASSSLSMSAGARKQKKSQDKVPLAPSAVEAKDVGNDEEPESSSLSNNYC